MNCTQDYKGGYHYVVSQTEIELVYKKKTQYI
jgi:hypothetical protein